LNSNSSSNLSLNNSLSANLVDAGLDRENRARNPLCGCCGHTPSTSNINSSETAAAATSGNQPGGCRLDAKRVPLP
jgi:hypothetical protein